MDLDYCSNDNCAEYSIQNKAYCSECFADLIQPFIKGLLTRIKIKKLTKSIQTIQALFNMKSIKYKYNPSILDSAYLTPNKSIIKHIFKKGFGKYPIKDQPVLVHYTGKLEDGTIFDSSYDRNQPFEFIVGTDNIIPLWNIGIQTMKKGERALFIGKSEHCYKDKEMPSIPANSTLYFDIELLDLKEKELFEMTPEERFEIMNEFRLKAKEAYTKNKLIDSINLYKKSIDSLLDDSPPEKLLLLLNLSILFSKILDWKNSLYYAELAYNIDSNNIKCLYRLGIAHYHLQNYIQSLHFAKSIIKIDNTNIMAKHLIKDSIINKNIELQKNKKMCQKMFS